MMVEWDDDMSYQEWSGSNDSFTVWLTIQGEAAPVQSKSLR